MKEHFHLLLWIGRLLSVSWRITWFIGGLAVLFLWNGYSPQWAVILLPVYFLVWIAALPLGHMLIEWAGKKTIGKLIMKLLPAMASTGARRRPSVQVASLVIALSKIDYVPKIDYLSKRDYPFSPQLPCGGLVTSTRINELVFPLRNAFECEMEEVFKVSGQIKLREKTDLWKGMTTLYGCYSIDTDIKLWEPVTFFESMIRMDAKEEVIDYRIMRKKTRATKKKLPRLAEGELFGSPQLTINFEGVLTA